MLPGALFLSFVPFFLCEGRRLYTSFGTICVECCAYTFMPLHDRCLYFRLVFLPHPQRLPPCIHPPPTLHHYNHTTIQNTTRISIYTVSLSLICRLQYAAVVVILPSHVLTIPSTWNRGLDRVSWTFVFHLCPRSVRRYQYPAPDTHPVKTSCTRIIYPTHPWSCSTFYAAR